MSKKPRTTPRKKPRQDRSQATVQAILDATARVLVETGYDRCSTNRVALAAGVSIGSLYQYYPSKEALVAALVERHTDAMLNLTRTELAKSATMPIRDAARAMVTAVIGAHMIDPKLHKVLMEQVPRVGRLEKLISVEEETQRLVLAYLKSRESELRIENLEVATFVLVNAVEGICHSGVLQRPPNAPLPELIEEVTDMIVRYAGR
jgi:AcrR family transcriptional regulator